MGHLHPRIGAATARRSRDGNDVRRAGGDVPRPQLRRALPRRAGPSYWTRPAARIAAARPTPSEPRAGRCGSAVPPVRVTFATFQSIQKVANDRKPTDMPFGSSSSLPPDRTVPASLVKAPSSKKVGEGSMVRLVAFLLDAHHSNLSNGEAVNQLGDPSGDGLDVCTFKSLGSCPAEKKSVLIPFNDG